jgi:hypothetical protein
MGFDMATALPGASADGATYFAHSCTRPSGAGLSVCWEPAHEHAAGELFHADHIEAAQTRRTLAFLGLRQAGRWGCLAGLNERGVAVGLAPTRSRLGLDRPGLTGPDLVRLMLERAAGARQAVDAAADLIVRHGQGVFPGVPAQDESDHAFLIADNREAILLTACGSHWAQQRVGGVRAAGEVCAVRQDWDRLSPGLSDLAIARGWQPADGRKLDFAGALAAPGPDDRAALRRWGRATMRLEEQRGAVDGPFLRRLLDDLRSPEAAGATAVNFVTRAGPGEAPPLAWAAVGPVGAAVYFPLTPEAPPPAAFLADAHGHCAAWRRTPRRAATAEWQAHLDHAAAEYQAEAAALPSLGDAGGRRRLAESFMEHNWERLEGSFDRGAPTRARTAVVSLPN